MKKCVLLFGIYSWMMQECGMMEKEDEHVGHATGI